MQWQWNPGDASSIQHFDCFLNGTRYRYSHIYNFHNHIKFINIQKNASTSWRLMLEYPLKKLSKDYFFTILRDPLQRIKSIFSYNKKQKNWSIDDQGSELIKPKNFLNDYEQFCHFLPQYMHLIPFEDEKINYYDLKDIPQLVKKFLKKMPRSIHHDNVTNPNQETVEQVDEWLLKNKDFVDDFLGPDIELYHNKIIKPSLK